MSQIFNLNAEKQCKSVKAIPIIYLSRGGGTGEAGEAAASPDFRG